MSVDATTRSPAKRALTELEACVLGVVAERAPCTAYTVRSVFAESPTRRFSGSAGAIYPLVRRLLKQGLLEAETFPRGSRSKTSYTVSASGNDALKAWLTCPIDEDVIAIPVDPVRTRLHFLSVLTPAAQLRWLEEVEQGLDTQVEALQAEWRDDPFNTSYERLLARGTLDLVETRRDWVRSVTAFVRASVHDVH